MSRMTTAVYCGTLAMLACCGAAFLHPSSGSAQSAGDGTVYLNQAWSQDDREWYYHFSQGSAVLSYDIFLNLEAAGSQELFRSDANTQRYGLIPETPSPYDPDGLPIGISKTTVEKAVGEVPAGTYAGLTCAACHESQLEYKGRHIRIEGGTANHFDIMAYIQALDDAVQATLTDSPKFDRLAARIGASSQDGKDDLRKRLQSEGAEIYNYRSRTLVAPTVWGPGRLDALTLIFDRVASTQAGIPENWSSPTAPVKPPFLWNAPHGLWTQWAAIGQDPIARNLGETMGVFMPINLKARTAAEGLFQSNDAVPELQRAEDRLERLAPPSWPEDVFGKIDREKAKAGKALFVELCASCHNVWPYRWTDANKYGKRFVLVGLTPQTYVGTDPTQFESIRPFAITGPLSETLPGELNRKDLVPAFAFVRVLQGQILERALSKYTMSDEEKLNLHGYREFPPPRPPDRVYKAAPRDGVWATGPFMHNGSVPNLYEVLIPAAERTKQFYIGREFDPVKVGVDTSANSGFLMDTALLGNSNAGHSFQDGPRGNGTIGPLLTDEQRWALVEYLKSIPEEPGRVTPFGGPPEKP